MNEAATTLTRAGRIKATHHDRFLDPQQHVVPGSSGVVSKIVIETRIGHRAALQERNDLLRPTNPDPAFRRLMLIVEEHTSSWQVHLAHQAYATTEYTEPIAPAEQSRERYMPLPKGSSDECRALFKLIEEAEISIAEALNEVFEEASRMLAGTTWITEIAGNVLLFIGRRNGPGFIRVDVQALKKTRMKDRAVIDRLFVGKTFEERWASYYAFKLAIEFLSEQYDTGLRFFDRRDFQLDPGSVQEGSLFDIFKESEDYRLL